MIRGGGGGGSLKRGTTVFSNIPSNKAMWMISLLKIGKLLKGNFSVFFICLLVTSYGRKKILLLKYCFSEVMAGQKAKVLKTFSMCGASC